MMLKRTSLLLFSVGLCLIAACSDDSKKDGVDNLTCTSWEDYAPLHQGTWWQFQRTDWMEGEEDLIYSFTTTVMAVDTLESGRPAFRTQDNDDDEMGWLLPIGCELRIYSEHPDSTDEYEVLLEKPLEVGNRWKLFSVSFGGMTVYAQIVSISDTVEVPAGTFTNCIHVQAPPYYHAWLHPDIGIIVAENTSFDGTYGVRDELQDYFIMDAEEPAPANPLW